MHTQNPNPYLIPGAVIVAALIIGASVMYGPQQPRIADNLANDPAPAGNQPAAPAVNAKDVNIAGDPFIGKTNAPVTLVYWSDYQCPFCEKFDTGTLRDVVKNYVNTGKLKVVFKDFQFLGPDSISMALAARAVWETYPDKFYAWREAMMDNQGQENSGYATREFILNVTKKVPGIDAAKIGSLMDKNKVKYTAAINADKAEGGKFGVQGTPGMIIGNKFQSGAAAYSTVSAIIDAQLK